MRARKKRQQRRKKGKNDDFKVNETNRVAKAVFSGVGILSGIGLIHSVSYGRMWDLTSIFNAMSNDEDVLDDVIEEPLEWDINDPILNKTNSYLSKYVCEDKTSDQNIIGTKGFCHYMLRAVPERRTHCIARSKSNSGLREGETVLILPRHFLIWDLDAMRDGFVRKLFSARHKDTDSPLDSGAFLSAYLIRRQKVGEKLWREHESKEKEYTIYTDENNSRLLEFLSVLPTYDNMREMHPTLWSEKDLSFYFGKSTPSYHLISGYRIMIISEYSAFCQVSANFKENVAMREYTAMRLNVMSRSFGPGAPGAEEEQNQDGAMKLEDELAYYKQEAGVELGKGCRAMSPILDMWDHHAKPNVEWRYKKNKRAFEIKVAKGGIPSGYDIMVSYGKYTDTHLFAKFGFVNGDGSGYTEASIAVMHKLLDVGMGQQFSYLKKEKLGDSTIVEVPLVKDEITQRRNLLQYLLFDDGYQDCIEKKENPDGYALKVLKFKYLNKIANKRVRWILKMPPRDKLSKPALSSNIQITINPPKFNPEGVTFDGSKLISTCRLIVLNNNDFNGEAIKVLSDVLRNNTADTFYVPKQTDELEYRALVCLTRLTTVALKQYSSNAYRDMRLLSSSSEETFFRSKKWNAVQVRLGEMQTLEVLRNIAAGGVKQMEKQVKDPNSSAMFIRHSPCPLEMTAPLLEH